MHNVLMPNFYAAAAAADDFTIDSSKLHFVI